MTSYIVSYLNSWQHVANGYAIIISVTSTSIKEIHKETSGMYPKRDVNKCSVLSGFSYAIYITAATM